MKTRHDIEGLKAGWLRDPCFDIEGTEGFEAHACELHAFRLATEARWRAAEDAREATTDAEADRLGLEMTMAASGGWSESGGPWITPQQAMKKVVWSETEVRGPQRFAGALPAPPSVNEATWSTTTRSRPASSPAARQSAA